MNKNVKRFIALSLVLLLSMGTYFLGYNQGKDKFATKEVIEVANKIYKMKANIDSEFLYDYDMEMMKDGIYKGYLAGLDDQYSAYYNAEEFKALNEHTEGEFAGVGIEISGVKGNKIVVISPIKGTPAEKAGIMAGDEIIAIDGKYYTNEEINDAVKVMRGKEGEKVTLTIGRQEKGEYVRKDIEIVREIIDVQSVYSEMIEGDLGYIYIASFQRHTADQFKENLKELKEQGAKKIVLDLRNNPGGLLDVTIDLADYLISDGTIVSVKDAKDKTQEYKAGKGSENIEMVTLINKGSASASEILSGALKENKRSVLVGETTFGKGVVQKIIEFRDEEPRTGMKLTIAEFFTPDGNKIQGVGVGPDKEVKLKEGVRLIGPENIKEDNQLQEAIKILKEKAS